MRIIVDENLPPGLVGWLADRGHAAEHVLDLNLQGAGDTQIWAAAQARGAFILSRDADFLALARATPSGGAIRLAFGNCTNDELFVRLASVWPAIERSWQAGERAIKAA